MLGQKSKRSFFEWKTAFSFWRARQVEDLLYGVGYKRQFVRIGKTDFQAYSLAFFRAGQGDKAGCIVHGDTPAVGVAVYVLDAGNGPGL